MAKTLLDGVNQVLLKTKILDNDSGVLTSLTDSARQIHVDTAVQVINEVIDDLYSPSVTGLSKPKQLKEATISLATGKRTVRLNSDVVTLRPEFDLRDRVNNHTIYITTTEAFSDLYAVDTEQDDTGLPHFAVIDPTAERQLRFDRAPTADENGNTYFYFYDRDMELVDKCDEFPFVNAVFRPVVVAATERWRYYQTQDGSLDEYNKALAAAASKLAGQSFSDSWAAPRGGINPMDPFNATPIS